MTTSPFVKDSNVGFATQFKEAFYQLSMYCPTFGQVLVQAMLALSTEENMYWISGPGRAKTMVARMIFGLFNGANMFMKQLAKDSMPEDLFGSVIVKQLMEHGIMKVNLANGIADVPFAFLDEFNDAAPYMQRALLLILNEHEFSSKDMGTIDCPLHSAICTTNFETDSPVTAAVRDRLLCKAHLGGVKDISDVMRANRTYLGYNGEGPKMKQLDYEALKSLAEYVQLPEVEGGITISPGIQLLHVLIIEEFQRQREQAAQDAYKKIPGNEQVVEAPPALQLGVDEVTPRANGKVNDLSRAAAALDDRSELRTTDLRYLGYGLITIGDNSGEDALWHALCDQYLNLNKRVLTSLEALGDLSITIGQLKAEKPRVTTTQMVVGGQAFAATELEIRRLIDKVIGAKHPLLDHARDSLKLEVSKLTEPDHGLELFRVN